jgi:hypothetical protein
MPPVLMKWMFSLLNKKHKACQQKQISLKQIKSTYYHSNAAQNVVQGNNIFEIFLNFSLKNSKFPHLMGISIDAQMTCVRRSTSAPCHWRTEF